MNTIYLTRRHWFLGNTNLGGTKSREPKLEMLVSGSDPQRHYCSTLYQNHWELQIVLAAVIASEHPPQNMSEEQEKKDEQTVLLIVAFEVKKYTSEQTSLFPSLG